MLYVVLFALAASGAPANAFEPESIDCTPSNLDYIKFLYKDNINGFNEAVSLYEHQHPGYTKGSIVAYIYNPFLQVPADLAKCLRDLGVDPSTVAQVSPQLQAVLLFDPERLNKTSPDFVRYVPIPEFGPLAAASLCILISASILFSRHGRGH